MLPWAGLKSMMKTLQWVSTHVKECHGQYWQVRPRTGLPLWFRRSRWARQQCFWLLPWCQCASGKHHTTTSLVWQLATDSHISVLARSLPLQPSSALSLTISLKKAARDKLQSIRKTERELTKSKNQKDWKGADKVKESERLKGSWQSLRIRKTERELTKS